MFEFWDALGTGVYEVERHSHSNGAGGFDWMSNER